MNGLKNEIDENSITIDPKKKKEKKKIIKKKKKELIPNRATRKIVVCVGKIDDPEQLFSSMNV